MITTLNLTSDDAAPMLAAATAHARAQGWAVSVAVVDAAGDLLAFVRLPGAPASSCEIAPAKARTAARMKRETVLVEKMVNDGRTAFLSAPGLSGLLEGGVPVLVNGQIVGAVGVSGVKSNEDVEIARAGIAALPTPAV